MLVVRFHVIASHYPIASSTTVKPGQVIALSSTGYCVLCDGNSGDTEAEPVGIAGDENGSLSANQFANKAWELGQETVGSGRLTVYHGGGEFYVDVGASTTTSDVVIDAAGVNVGQKLYASSANDGYVNDSDTSNAHVFTVLDNLSATNGLLDSGIPGPVNLPVGDLDSTRTFALVRLVI